MCTRTTKPSTCTHVLHRALWHSLRAERARTRALTHGRAAAQPRSAHLQRAEAVAADVQGVEAAEALQPIQAQEAVVVQLELPQLCQAGHAAGHGMRRAGRGMSLARLGMHSMGLLVTQLKLLQLG